MKICDRNVNALVHQILDGLIHGFERKDLLNERIVVEDSEL